ncbi:hypothetical protein BJV74DRAFT_86294 [Russula compacta]|nr:hypothetical protein BJV74DRAFT_86294 [Russula compacta]
MKGIHSIDDMVTFSECADPDCRSRRLDLELHPDEDDWGRLVVSLIKGQVVSCNWVPRERFQVNIFLRVTHHVFFFAFVRTAWHATCLSTLLSCPAIAAPSLISHAQERERHAVEMEDQKMETSREKKRLHASKKTCICVAVKVSGPPVPIPSPF